MKILLLGEYNSSHYTLKEGLVTLGHEVTVLGLGDGFKNRLVDINFQNKFIKGFPRFVKRVIYKLFKVDINSLNIRKQFYKHQDLFKGNDIVQLINENTFGTVPKIEKELLAFVFEHNKNVFLLSCGTDYPSVKYAMDDNFKYSILTPFKEGRGSAPEYLNAIKHTSTPYIELHHFIYKSIKGVIASDLDYEIPLLGNKKYLGMVANPIKTEQIKYIHPVLNGKISIFHGINRSNYHKKGNYIFEKALKIISEKFKDKIEIITVENVPYKTYINLFNSAHILLDQVFAYDQGFNALEAMAKGKVVFTGAEKEWLDYYKLEEDTVAINALPDPIKIAEKLEWLILNPEKILEISQNARKFIEAHHNYIDVSQKYFDKWSSKI
ncbi:glycosyl transferase family 1 [Patiriisocius marinistellae]|uniref:Glycosyl transferase family 1 n=1 Tax=Patiriisocius marinistellae TaxID=2494560 RepID=A0A5J4G3E7_9FLAO|nr:glycosyltransferase [Patiriisocius marinistellae]GEQ87315.1 glycosyl transferase family 1 [Patiriisocius marinistellae]